MRPYRIMPFCELFNTIKGILSYHRFLAIQLSIKVWNIVSLKVVENKLSQYEHLFLPSSTVRYWGRNVRGSIRILSPIATEENIKNKVASREKAKNQYITLEAMSITPAAKPDKSPTKVTHTNSKINF